MFNTIDLLIEIGGFAFALYVFLYAIIQPYTERKFQVEVCESLFKKNAKEIVKETQIQKVVCEPQP